MPAFKMALPVLAGFIAYGMAGKPGLVPGLLGGYLAGTTNAGFLGALLVGLLAGHVVNLLKKMPVHKYVRPIMPILIIPIVSGLVVGTVMLKVIGVPIAELHDVPRRLAADDEQRERDRARDDPRRDDRVRHGRAGEQGGVLLRRGDDQGRQLRDDGRLRRGDLHAAAGPGAGDARRAAACGPRSRRNRASRRSAWGWWASPRAPSRLRRPIPCA